MLRQSIILVALLCGPAIAQQTTCERNGDRIYCNTAQPPDTSAYQNLGAIIGRAIAQKQAAQAAARQQESYDAEEIAHREMQEREKAGAQVREQKALQQVPAAGAPYATCLLDQAKKYAAPGVQPSDSVAAARAKCADLRRPLAVALEESFRVEYNDGRPLTEPEVTQLTDFALHEIDASAADSMTAVVLDELAIHKKDELAAHKKR